MQYETVVKESLEKNRPSLLTMLAGQAVGKSLNVELKMVEKRVADLLFELGPKGLFHLEIQGWNFAKMPHRMGIYGLLAAWQLNKEAVLQVVLYIGRRRCKMPDQIDLGGITCRCRIVDIREFDAAELLESSNPADHVLALLARNGVMHLRKIVRQIAKLRGVERQQCIGGLLVLSQLRGVTRLLKMEMEATGMRIDIERNVVLREIRDTGFQKGLTKGRSEGRVEGLAKGLAKGRAKGRAEGKAEGKAETFRVLLQQKFGRVPQWAAKRVDAATPRQVDRWLNKIVNAPTIQDLIGAR